MQRGAVLLVVVTVLSIFVGCSHPPEQSFQRGFAAQEAGRFDEAIEAYSAAIASDPDLAMAYYNRGLARLEVEDFEGALKDLSRTVDLETENSDALLARGVAFQALERHDEAVLDFTAALDLDELDAEAHRQRAFSWQALRESDAAVADLGMAIRLEPDRPELYRERAEARRERGDDRGASLDETLAEFTQRIGESDDITARRARGQAFYLLAEYEVALADLSIVLKKEPADEAALLSRGQTLFVLGDDEAALADFDVVINAGGQRVSAALAGRAVLHESQDDLAAAIRDYVQAIELSPDDDDLLARCAWLMATSGDSKLRDGNRAVEYGRRACELTEWQDWFCIDAYAAALAETGDFESAVAWQNQALLIGPEASLGQIQNRLDAYRNNLPYRMQ